VLVQDGTSMNVRVTAPFESTHSERSAVKMLGTLSLDHGALLDVRFAAAVHHDHPLLRGQRVPGALYLRDLGFYDHREFAAIEDAKSLFVSRLKLNARPTIQRVFRGLAAQGLDGEELHDGLPYESVVDVDAHFRVENEPNGRVFRVVKVDVPARDRRGRMTGKTLECWYVTNLPRDQFSAEMIRLLYVLRWAIERHWRSCKDLARLDHLNTGRPTVLWVFIAVSLLLQTLADQITAELRASRMRSAVSSEIVLATVIEWWNDIASWLRRSDGFEQIRWIAFRNVLVYDSRHRYSTRPRRIEQVLDEITQRVQERTMAA
jgi:Transposase DDE domain